MGPEAILILLGPRPLGGEPAHPYTIQIFALDQKLDQLPGAGRKEVLAACQGQVLATGMLQGLFARPDRPKKPRDKIALSARNASKNLSAGE